MLTTPSPAVATEGTVPHRAAFDLQKWPETVKDTFGKIKCIPLRQTKKRRGKGKRGKKVKRQRQNCRTDLEHLTHKVSNSNYKKGFNLLKHMGKYEMVCTKNIQIVWSELKRTR